ncbi:hypothetical protein P7C70_g5099, partial [Phenoliferia sp. Uapishka_3]
MPSTPTRSSWTSQARDRRPRERDASTPTEDSNPLSSYFESPSPNQTRRSNQHFRATSVPSVPFSVGKGHERSRSWLTSYLRPRTSTHENLPPTTAPPLPNPLPLSPTRTPRLPLFRTRERSGSVGETLKRGFRKHARPAAGTTLESGISAYSEYEVAAGSASTPPSMSFPVIGPPSATYSSRKSGEALAQWNEELKEVTAHWRSSTQSDLPPLGSPIPERPRRASYHGHSPRRTMSQSYVTGSPNSSTDSVAEEIPALELVWDDFLAEADLTFDADNASVLFPSPLPKPTSRASSTREGWRSEGHKMFPARSDPFALSPSRSTPGGDKTYGADTTYADSPLSVVLSLSTFPSPPLAGSDPFQTLPLFSSPRSLAERRSRAIPALVFPSPSRSPASPKGASYFSPASPDGDESGDSRFFADFDSPIRNPSLTSTTLTLQGLAIAPSSFDAHPLHPSISLTGLNELNSSPQSPNFVCSKPLSPSPAGLKSDFSPKSFGSSISSTISSPYEYSRDSFETTASSVVAVGEAEWRRWPKGDWEVEKTLFMGGKEEATHAGELNGMKRNSKGRVDGAGHRRRETVVFVDEGRDESVDVDDEEVVTNVKVIPNSPSFTSTPKGPTHAHTACKLLSLSLGGPISWKGADCRTCQLNGDSAAASTLSSSALATSFVWMDPFRARPRPPGRAGSGQATTWQSTRPPLKRDPTPPPRIPSNVLIGRLLPDSPPEDVESVPLPNTSSTSRARDLPSSSTEHPYATPNRASTQRTHTPRTPRLLDSINSSRKSRKSLRATLLSSQASLADIIAHSQPVTPLETSEDRLRTREELEARLEEMERTNVENKRKLQLAGQIGELLLLENKALRRDQNFSISAQSSSNKPLRPPPSSISTANPSSSSAPAPSRAILSATPTPAWFPSQCALSSPTPVTPVRNQFAHSPFSVNSPFANTPHIEGGKGLPSQEQLDELARANEVLTARLEESESDSKDQELRVMRTIRNLNKELRLLRNALRKSEDELEEAADASQTVRSSAGRLPVMIDRAVDSDIRSSYIWPSSSSPSTLDYHRSNYSMSNVTPHASASSPSTSSYNTASPRNSMESNLGIEDRGETSTPDATKETLIEKLFARIEELGEENEKLKSSQSDLEDELEEAHLNLTEYRKKCEELEDLLVSDYEEEIEEWEEKLVHPHRRRASDPSPTSHHESSSRLLRHRSNRSLGIELGPGWESFEGAAYPHFGSDDDGDDVPKSPTRTPSKIFSLQHPIPATDPRELARLSAGVVPGSKYELNQVNSPLTPP